MSGVCSGSKIGASLALEKEPAADSYLPGSFCLELSDSLWVQTSFSMVPGQAGVIGSSGGANVEWQSFHRQQVL